MPIRLENSETSTQDLFRHCIAPSISTAVLFAGVARVFTSINPINAAIIGAVVPICDYALDKILPDLHCFEAITANEFTKYVITRLSSYALGTLTAATMGFPITLTKALLLSASSNLLLVGSALTVVFIASRFFAADAREAFMDRAFDTIGLQYGHPVVAAGMLFGGVFLTAIVDDPNASEPDGDMPELEEIT